MTMDKTVASAPGVDVEKVVAATEAPLTAADSVPLAPSVGHEESA